MKKKYIFISILVVAIIAAVIALVLFIPNNNSKEYLSELTGKNILVPQGAFGFSEGVDEDTYTVRFYVLGTEENVVKVMHLLEQQSDDDIREYVIDQWASNSHGFYHDVYITYTDVEY